MHLYLGYGRLLLRHKAFTAQGSARTRPASSGNGLGAAIYTQWNDVETEVNGLLTYDRRLAAMELGKPEEVEHDLSMPLLLSLRQVYASLCQGQLKLPLEFYQEFSRLVRESARKCMSATELQSSECPVPVSENWKPERQF